MKYCGCARSIVRLGVCRYHHLPFKLASLRHLRFAQPVMRLSWALQTGYSALRQFSPFALPAVLFGIIYNQVYIYWFATVGHGSWAPAWPASRTRFVFLMVAIPTWGMIMASWTIVYAIICSIWAQRQRGIADYEAINLDPPEETRIHSRSPRRGYGQYRWHATLVAYLSLALAGVFMLATYEQPNDVRYRPDIQAALKSPRPEGHGNGGECFIWCNSFVNSRCTEKVFIGAMFYNNQQIIPYWSEEMIKIIKYLGTVSTIPLHVCSYKYRPPG